MNNNINLNLLKYFYETVNIGNITKASKKMLVSQPAITKAIKELESELNVKLLERSKKGVVPTEEGKVLHEHIKDMFQNFASTLNVIEKIDNNQKHFYIGTTTTNFMIFIVDALEQFKKKHPNIHIHIVLESINILSDMERLGHLDILIKNDYEHMKNFINIKNFKIQDEFIASKKHFKELDTHTYTINELLKYPFVLLSNITHGRKNFDAFLKTKGIDFKPTYEFNSYSLCTELIKSGFGIGIGNPIHYNTKDYIIIKTNEKLPVRKFNIGYINQKKDTYIDDFIKLITKR